MEPITRRAVLRGIGALGLGAAAFSLTPQAFAGAVVTEPADLLGRWRDLLTGGVVDLTDPYVKKAVARIDRVAVTARAGLDPSRTDGLWPDLTSTTLSNHVTTSFKRLQTMAVAWATPGTTYAGDDVIADLIVAGLRWMYDHRYSPALARFDNDWDWEIGSALALNDCVVLLRDKLDVATFTAAVDHYTPDPNLWRVDRQIATGANRVWVSTVVAVRAVLDGDAAALAAVRDALSDVEGGGANSVLAFNDGRDDGTGEGFYSDGSFLQHYKHPYNGGYGKELLNNLSKLLYLLGDTTWEVTDPELANVYAWVDEGFDPLIARGDVMHAACGREIARPSKQNHAAAQAVVEATLRLIPAAPAATATRLTALAKQWITEDTYRDFRAVTDVASLIAAQETLASSTPARGALVRHKQYPRMDKLVHHRPAFTVGVSAYSERIYNYESIQNENLHGWHLSDGMVLLYDADLGHYSEDYWPTVDPYRLAGTTVDSVRLADSANQRTSSAASWVGGAALPGRTIGAYGMDLRTITSTFRALKSWFCVDDVIACVGTGIAGGTAAIETVVENRKLRDETAALLVDGTAAPADPGWSATLDDVGWLHLAGTGGYVFPAATRVRALRERRTATWRQINLKYGTDTEITRPYLTLWLDHGTAPSAAGYHYLMLPTATADATARAAAAPPVCLVAANDTVHAVRAGTTLAANFFSATRVADLAADGPASVVVGKERSTVTVAVSDPTQTRDQVVVDLFRPGLVASTLDEGVRVEARPGGVRVIVDTAGRHGATAAAVLVPQGR
jgi:hyaluronate lyase